MIRTWIRMRLCSPSLSVHSVHSVGTKCRPGPGPGPGPGPLCVYPSIRSIRAYHGKQWQEYDVNGYEECFEEENWCEYGGGGPVFDESGHLCNIFPIVEQEMPKTKNIPVIVFDCLDADSTYNVSSVLVHEEMQRLVRAQACALARVSSCVYNVHSDYKYVVDDGAVAKPRMPPTLMSGSCIAMAPNHWLTAFHTIPTFRISRRRHIQMLSQIIGIGRGHNDPIRCDHAFIAMQPLEHGRDTELLRMDPDAEPFCDQVCEPVGDRPWRAGVPGDIVQNMLFHYARTLLPTMSPEDCEPPNTDLAVLACPAEAEQQTSDHLLPAVFDDQELHGATVAMIGYKNEEQNKSAFDSFRLALGIARIADANFDKIITGQWLELLSSIPYKGVYCGKVQAVSSTHGIICTNSSFVGCSGGAYFLLDESGESVSRGLIGLHIGRAKDHAECNLFVTVNHPQFVAKWAKYCYPNLSQEKKAEAAAYVQKHRRIIECIV